MTIIGLVGLRSLAGAQEPKFEYGKAEEVKVVEYKLQSKGGLLLTAGNSRSLSISGGVLASRRDARTKVSLDAGLAFAQADVLVAKDTNGNMVIDRGEDYRETRTTSNAWFVKGRFDLFVTTNNAAYIAALVSADVPAGKELVGGGQIGYSRTLVKTAVNEVVAEIGYDFSYEKYIARPEGVQIHSARLFAGYTAKLTDGTAAWLSCEVLANLNSENAPNANDPDPTKPVGPFMDMRVVGKGGVTTKLWRNFNLSLGATVKYDDNPAPRATLGMPYAAGYTPFADKYDIIVESALIIDFV